MRLVLALSIVLLVSCGGGGGGGGSVGSAPTAVTVNYAAIVASLDDGRTAVQVLSAADYTRVHVVAPSDLDLTIDRREVLAQLFARVAQGTDRQRVEAWVRYVQKRMAHPATVPLMTNGMAVFDPLWLLENRVGQCGQTNRVLVDGLLAAGFQARVVQLTPAPGRGHVAAEVWLDGQWRYLDADWLNAFVLKADGHIASAHEIFLDPTLVDGLDESEELAQYPVPVLPPGALDYTQMFAVQPYYYVKTATPEQERNEYYGWDLYYQTVH